MFQASFISPKDRHGNGARSDALRREHKTKLSDGEYKAVAEQVDEVFRQQARKEYALEILEPIIERGLRGGAQDRAQDGPARRDVVDALEPPTTTSRGAGPS